MYRKQGRRQKRSGFTLVELLMTIAILGILGVIAVPGMIDFMRAQKVKAATNEFSISLAYARSEAVKRNATVTVTPVSAANWEQGWSVVVGGTTLNTVAAQANVDITPSSATASIGFNGLGRITTLPSDDVDFVFCDVDNTSSVMRRTVNVDASGKALVEIDGYCS